MVREEDKGREGGKKKREKGMMSIMKFRMGRREKKNRKL